MDNNKIGKFPKKLNSAIKRNHITTIMLGCIGVLGVFALNFFVFKNSDEALAHLLEKTSYGIALVILISFVIYPLILLLTNHNRNVIVEHTKNAGLNFQQLCYDFENNKSFHKLKIGEFFIFYKNPFMYYAIPTDDIVIVKKHIKIRKIKTVKKSRDGYVEDVKENISTTRHFFVDLETIYGKKIRIPCNFETNADDIVLKFKRYKNIIQNSSELSKKKIKKIVKKIKEQRKGSYE